MKKIISRTEAQAYGLKRYFTGIPCPRGHVCERRVSNYVCCNCNAENQRGRSPEKESDRKREWRLKNRAKTNQYHREWRARNREAYNQWHREYDRKRRGLKDAQPLPE
jgi:hypothetical protein